MSSDLLHFIDGDFKPSQTHETFKSPFDDAELARVYLASPMDLVTSLADSKKAHEAWETKSFDDRAALLDKIATVLESRAGDIAASEALFQGLPTAFVLEKSVKPAIAKFRHHANRLRETAIHYSSSPNAKTSLQSTGLTAIIAPGPLSLLAICERLAPALAAGNSVLIKASRKSPVTARTLGEALKASETPAGLVQILIGRGDELGAFMAVHPSIGSIAFAGSSRTLAKIAATAGPALKKLQLCGSGKNSLLILGDADLDKHWNLILESCLLGQGRLPGQTARVFVLESMAKDFFERLEASLASLKPLMSPAGFEVWTPLGRDPKAADVFQGWRAETENEQGKVIEAPAAGDFHRPALFTRDLSNCSVLQQEDLQAPVFIVTAVKYAHEMVKWSNTGDLGHSAIVLGSEEKAHRLGEKLKVGRVWINQWKTGSEPVFGAKKSFYGIPDAEFDGNFHSDVKTVTT